MFLEDEIRFYYGAYASWNSDLNTEEPTGIGMAALPRDRFAGIRPLDRIGQLTLKPLDLADTAELSLNANATEGEIRVELLTADGYRIRGLHEGRGGCHSR